MPSKVVQLSSISEHELNLITRLESAFRADPDGARGLPKELIVSGSTLAPDRSGRYLWAKFGDQEKPLLAATAGVSEIMVAGVGFEPTTFGL
jgi:hypothetical protein